MIYYFFFLLLLGAGCVHVPEDPLVEMSESVVKKKTGVDIRITPVEKQK